MKSEFKATRLVSSERPRLEEVLRDRGGAAMVEFAMAIMPVLMVFFGTLQWTVNAYIHLLVKHAAFSIVRCEAVVHPGAPDSGDENKDCLNKDPSSTSIIGTLFRHAANTTGVFVEGNAILGDLGLGGGISSGDFTIDTTLANPNEQKLDSVKVSLQYRCTVPLGNVLACGAGRVQKLEATANFPNQGSAYQPIWFGS